MANAFGLAGHAKTGTYKNMMFRFFHVVLLSKRLCTTHARSLALRSASLKLFPHRRPARRRCERGWRRLRNQPGHFDDLQSSPLQHPSRLSPNAADDDGAAIADRFRQFPPASMPPPGSGVARVSTKARIADRRVRRSTAAWLHPDADSRGFPPCWRPRHRADLASVSCRDVPSAHARMSVTRSSRCGSPNRPTASARQRVQCSICGRYACTVFRNRRIVRPPFLSIFERRVLDRIERNAIHDVGAKCAHLLGHIFGCACR